jgi:hypothetical protein
MAGIMGWLLPGLGHLFLGLRRRGVFFLVTVTALFVLGFFLGNAEVVSLQTHPVAFLAQIFCGGPTLLALVIGPALDGFFEQHPIASPRTMDLGMLMTIIAGALNALLMADAYATHEKAKLRAREETA